MDLLLVLLPLTIPRDFPMKQLMNHEESVRIANFTKIRMVERILNAI